jgi:hypothetical protein
MKWITRSHVHVDRVACPWLITRFIDSDAEFLFVPASQVERVAAETGATPRLARIVHAADVAADADSDPLARGLEAIATGFGVRYPADHENLAAQLEVYDALYAWCRLQGTVGNPQRAAPG